MTALDSPLIGTTFSWLRWPKCGVSITRPVTALTAIEMPPFGVPIHSSPVKNHGVPRTVSRVAEQKYWYPSDPSSR